MQLPATIGKYQLFEFVRGDLAEVYRARDISNGAVVLMIVLSPEASASPEARARFLRDARVAGTLDSGEHEGRYYAVVEEHRGELIHDPQIRVRESPGGSLLRLSMIVYATVILVTIIAIITWFKYHKLFPESEPAPREVVVSKGPDIVRGMIFIEAGTFLAGPDNHPVTLPAFYIDQAEVTAGQYCSVMACPQAPVRRDLPMVGVTIEQARQYAMQAGRRLPTALEWERAARGTNGKRYPWGDAAEPSLANVANNAALGGHALVPVRSFQPYPEYQMIGNVWEMVEGAATPDAAALARFSNLLKPAPTATEPWIAARGGSYKTRLSLTSMWDSLIVPERYSAPDLGFRCARNP